MKETIFFLEGRGGMWFYHFFIYNLGGLYYILNEKYDVRGIPEHLSVKFVDTSKIVDKPSSAVSFPIKIHMNDILPFQRELFEIISPDFIPLENSNETKSQLNSSGDWLSEDLTTGQSPVSNLCRFKLVEDLSEIQDYEIVSICGEPSINKICENETIIYPFIRNLILEKMKFDIIPKKRIFITRKNSETQHNGLLKRYILNENEIKEKLEKYNFEYIQLEDYNMYDKIKLFMESELIMSSNSGALTLILFCNKNTKIIEILNKGTNGFSHNHFTDIASVIGLNYSRYSDIIEDHNGNFNLEFDKFEEFLLTKIE